MCKEGLRESTEIIVIFYQQYSQTECWKKLDTGNSKNGIETEADNLWLGPFNFQWNLIHPLDWSFLKLRNWSSWIMNPRGYQ